MNTSRNRKILLWTLRLIAAIVLLQTLRFKFTAASESVYIFSTLGIEPWGRIGTGVVELIASLLILWPCTSAWGALLSAGVLAGAIFSHLTILEINVQLSENYLYFTKAIINLTLYKSTYIAR